MTAGAARARRRRRVIQDPPFARALLQDTRFAWIWLAARIYLGWQWLDAGANKLRDPAWMDGGTALKGSWEGIVAVPRDGGPAGAEGWYGDLIQLMLDHEWYAWMAPAIAVGETLAGIALILGLFTGLAAFAGSVTSVSITLSGPAATNPLFLMLAILLMLAWKTAGWIGLDRWLLPLVEARWRAAGQVPGRAPPRQAGTGPPAG